MAVSFFHNSGSSELSDAPEHGRSSGRIPEGAATWSRSLWPKAAELLKDERVQTGVGMAVAAAMAATRAKSTPESTQMGTSTRVSNPKGSFFTRFVAELQQAYVASQNQLDPRLTDPAEPTLSPDVFPAPPEPVIGVFEGPHVQTTNTGGYELTYNPYNAERPVFRAVSLDFPHMIGGTYDVASLQIGHWYALHDRRGFQLPISLQKAAPQTIKYRIDPNIPDGLPKLAPMPGWGLPS